MILTNYPLSKQFEFRVLELAKPGALHLTLGELRQKPFWQMLKYMRSLKVDSLLIPVEDENSSAFLPLIKIFASAFPSRRTYIVEPELILQKVRRIDTAFSFVHLMIASILSQLAALMARFEISKLSSENSITIQQPVGKKVIYLNTNLWFGIKAGGSVGHVSGVVNGLIEHGFDLHFVSSIGRLMVGEKARYTKLRPPKCFGLPWETNFYRFHYDIVEQTKKVCSTNDFDFIYQRLSLANYSGVVLSRLLDIPLVVEYNGSDAWVANNWGEPLREQVLAEQVEQSNLRHAHLVVTVSEVLRDDLVKRGVHPDRIVTYPNCIDPEIFNPSRFSSGEVADLRSSLGIPKEALLITFMGTFGKWHGVEVLAETIRRMIDEDRDWIEANKVCFMLVGDGVKMPLVHQILKEKAESRYLTLTGLIPQQDAPLYLAASDILVSPHVANEDGSKFFGSPTKLFEYMAMGKPIIASDLDQIGHVLKDSVRIDSAGQLDCSDHKSKVAVLLEPGNHEELAISIKILAESPELRRQLGMNARNLALSRYTWFKHVDEISKNINRL